MIGSLEDNAKLLHANIKHAAFNREVLSIGGGDFDAVTVKKVFDEYERQIDILKQFASDLAEGDCEYGDNCPKGTRHGVCYSCQARKALDQLTKPVA